MTNLFQRWRENRKAPAAKGKKSYTLNMTFRCVSFLGLLAVLALADYLILYDQIKTHQFDAALINIAGRQRLFFERAALLARYLVSTPDKRERANVRGQLLDSIQLLEEYEGLLMKPDPKLEGHPPPTVKAIYFSRPFFLHTRLSNYLTELKALSLTRDENLRSDDARLVSIRTVASGKILKGLDSVVNEYQRVSETKIAKAQNLQRWVFESTLLALLVIGIYLFRPMIRSVQQEVDKLEDVNKLLGKRIEDQKRIEDALRDAVNDLAHTNNQLDQMGQDLRNANAQFEKLALLDPLTELLNRRGLQKALTTEIDRISRTHSDLCAILVDLDDFKQINDTLGYPVGDIVLKEIALRLKEALRGTDYVARIGGDEFMILLTQIRRAEGMRVAEKIRFAISESSVLLSSGKAVKVTASLGFAEVSPETPSIDELLTEINPVLHQSKKSGKNRVSQHFYPVGSEAEILHEDGSFSDFNRVVKQRNHLYALRQPIFLLSDISTFGYEFLSRSLIEGCEMPDDFFRICLEANNLTLVDHQCFKTCISAGLGLPPDLHHHLNLFPSTLINIPIPDLLGSIPPQGAEKKYCIEISEQQIIGDPSYLLEAVREIKQANILIGIDDVGFGRSCLESLILLEPDVIKIDKKCVKGIAQDPAHARALKQLLKVAQALGTEVMAEGIETHDDLSMLRDLGVKYGQGFLLGMPT